MSYTPPSTPDLYTFSPSRSALNLVQRSSKKAYATEVKKVAFKVAIFVTMFIALAVILVGTIALLASKGTLPDGMDSFKKLAIFGEVNSGLLIAGGLGLFIVSVIAFGYRLQVENHKTPQKTARKLEFDDI